MRLRSGRRRSVRTLVACTAATVAAAMFAAACSSSNSSTDATTAATTATTQDAVAAAEARVAAAQTALDTAKAAFTSAGQQFCSDAKGYVTALDRYGKLFTDSKATVGDVKTGGADLAAPQGAVSSSADAVTAAQGDVQAAEKELADAEAALADARSAASSVPTSATTAPSPSSTTLVPPATVTRVKQAEADLAKASSGITDATPLVQASAAYNSAAFALEIAWLQLLSDAGCLSDAQQAQAVSQVSEYTAALQTDLQQAGYYKGSIDGIYGPLTVEAVTTLQTDSGLAPTGLVDQATALALEKKLAEVGAQAASAVVDPDRRCADRPQGHRPLDRGDRRQVDTRADRRPQNVPDRARRTAHRSRRRGDPGGLRTGPRSAPDRGDHHHDRRAARHASSCHTDDRGVWRCGEYDQQRLSQEAIPLEAIAPVPLTADVAPSRRTLAVAAALVGVNLALFVLIAEDLLDGGGLIAHDEAVLSWFVDHRTDAWIRVAKLVSTLGGFVSLAIIAALIGIWLWRCGTHPMLAAAPLASLVAGKPRVNGGQVDLRSRSPARRGARHDGHAGCVPFRSRDRRGGLRPRCRAHARARGRAPAMAPGGARRGRTARRRTGRSQPARARRALAL